jgi:hypothetical protein
MKYEFIYRQFLDKIEGDCSLSKLERVPDILWKSMKQLLESGNSRMVLNVAVEIKKTMRR